MQPTIASFFQKANTVKSKSSSDGKEAKKRKARIVSSDEDDESIAASPQVTGPKGSKKLKTTTNGEGDQQASCSPSAGKRLKLEKLKTKSPKKEIKSVDVMAMFGGETKRVEAKRPPKPKEKTLQELENDEIDKSLMEVDLDESVLQKLSPEKKHEQRSNLSSSANESNSKAERHETKSSAKKDKNKTTNKNKTPEKNKITTNETKTPTTNKNFSSFIDDEDEEDNSYTKKKQKAKHDLDSSVLTDEDRHERKRAAAILYQKYKNRSSVLNHGCKEIPKGKPNCLAGLTFLVTGVLESMERKEAESVIKEYGGKTMTTVGKRLNYLMIGEEAGPQKLAKADEFKVNIISEDDFFDLIRKKSGLEVQNGNHNIKDDCEKPSTSPKEKKEKKKEDIKNIHKGKHANEIKKEKMESTPEKKPKLEKTNDHLITSKVKKEKTEVEKHPEVKQEFPRPPPPTEDMMAWVDRYKPTSVKEIIGQQGPASNVAKLTNWLSKWYINHDGKKKLQKPNPWAKNDDGGFYKAALLSGPPGIGKTTTATLVCKELGFDIVEFNASDTRSKRLLKEEVSQLLHNKSLYGYFHGESLAVTKKHVLIMDEVDGMAGNEDRGGIQELIGLIKDASVPIICMCNDRNHQKMRSLVNYCYDLRFNRPQLKQIKGRIMSICARENIKLDSNKIDEIITATNNDIRQSINHISLLSAGKELNLKSETDSKHETDKIAQKDLKMGPWEVVRKVFSADQHKSMSFYDKCDLFFHDYSLSPLFVQQNYLIVNPTGPRSEVIQKVALTADALSLGDLVDKRIRSNSAWALLPTQAVFSSVMPGEYMCGNFTGQINFPGWLGKNSRATKRCRLAQEIHDHTRVKTSGSRLSIRMDYAPYLLNKIVRPLVEKGLEGVEESLETLKEYHLLREDIESLIELSSWPGKKSPMDGVDGKVKAALTRAYNKEVLAYSYSATTGAKKKKAEAADDLEAIGGLEGDEGVTATIESDDEKDDDLENDALVKTKKKTAASSTKTSTTKKTTSSKAKAITKAKK